MGKRISLATLAQAEVMPTPGLRVDSGISVQTDRTVMVPLARVAANPINPRENFGDLSDLESMRTVGQLQPCAVVGRAAFAAIYPEYQLPEVDFVIVAGSRRRAAAEKFGLEFLSVTVLERLALSRAQFFAASVAENIDRRNFDVVEEARAVQRLVKEIGSGTEAGEILGKTKGWVSQRLALLRLSLPMMDLLRAGELPVRQARRLAALAPDDQLAAWHEECRVAAQGARFTAVNRARPPTLADAEDAPPTAPKPVVTLARGASVQQIADGLRDCLCVEDVSQLAYALLRRS